MQEDAQHGYIYNMTITASTRAKLEILRRVPALAEGCEKSLVCLAETSEQINLKQGETLIRAGRIETHAFLILKGALRLLAEDPFNNDLYTVGMAEANEIVGVVDLLRQGSCEAAIARVDSSFLSFPLELLLELIKEDLGLSNGLQKITSPCEGAMVLKQVVNDMNPPPTDGKRWILQQLKVQNREKSITKQILSSVLAGREKWVGKIIDNAQIAELQESSILPLRFWDWMTDEIDKDTASPNENNPKTNEVNTHKSEDSEKKKWIPKEDLDLISVGLREAQTNKDLQGFKLIKGKGPIKANIATLRMVARALDTPCPVDVIEKVIEASVERSGAVAIQQIGQLTEAMGLQTQVGDIKIEQITKLEMPVLINRGRYYALLVEAARGSVVIADPEKGWITIPMEEIRTEWGDELPIILLRRLADTPKRKFGWDWFTPVLKKFKWPLIQVLLASLFIQLFQLANPLLLQQIIDKVISQSNLSALQVLGSALVAAALFQGMLTAVRTWLLIDTTDRMDLVLGSQVIDKLLRLPLRFFEKRPVGELSQRLSELGNLRGFLTGTAITSALDLLFATIYIFIMLVYSPLLTAVALGTVPIYVALILSIAPIYRGLIRKQAQFAARTQSHLIETLGGIQTVKAQHFELNSRWRWQERYSGQIAEAFKSVILGSSASEIGNFLNQLSALLIIWVGVYLVVKGELSLGQLIAFRIIAGYVTGPILRLSSLWQGFQQVSISMERLADIVDQVPEAGENDSDQISLPPIKGDVSFDKLKFRFNRSGDYQINEVSLEVNEGSFIGIVGQSGSGKSTLMKLLPRLYEPEEGRILIDGYDIAKVSMTSIRQQIGIVPQDCLLFEGTVRENIAMNNPEADTETIIRVARDAAAHDFIMDLPDGYGTKLGERGSGLSGGQRQRIAIARTLIQNPNILVLDEATSSLDYDTEATVCQNLQKALKGKTVFFITHRLSTVRGADKIVLMHEGRISESGNHEELIAMGGRYSALYSHQGDS